MMKKIWVLLSFTIFATPTSAFASSHGGALENLSERLTLIVLPLALAAVLAFRGRKAWALASVAAAVLPMLWAAYRVWSMNGPWNMPHLGRHHAEATPFMLAYVITVVAIVLRPAPEASPRATEPVSLT